jgi:hypothetical protein
MHGSTVWKFTNKPPKKASTSTLKPTRSSYHSKKTFPRNLRLINALISISAGTTTTPGLK